MVEPQISMDKALQSDNTFVTAANAVAVVKSATV